MGYSQWEWTACDETNSINDSTNYVFFFFGFVFIYEFLLTVFCVLMFDVFIGDTFSLFLFHYNSISNLKYARLRLDNTDKSSIQFCNVHLQCPRIAFFVRIVHLHCLHSDFVFEEIAHHEKLISGHEKWYSFTKSNIVSRKVMPFHEK